eukprot:m.75972 g.75972  ORF g.75972 m.75972 type:complete len:531 (+) comp12471_c0_seq1:251-1843(+)
MSMTTKLPPIAPRATLRTTGPKGRGGRTGLLTRTGLGVGTIAGLDHTRSGVTAIPKQNPHKDECLQLLVSGQINAFVEFFSLTTDAPASSPLGQGQDPSLLKLLRSNLAQCDDAMREQRFADAASIRSHMSDIFMQHNDPNNAIDQLKQGVEAAALSKSVATQCQALGRLSTLIETQGNVEAALRYTEVAVQLIEANPGQSASITLKNAHGTMNVFQIAARQYLMRAQKEVGTQQGLDATVKARHYCQACQSDDQSDNVGLAELTLDVLLWAAKANENIGNLDEAVKLYDEYLTALNASGTHDGSGQSQACLGLARCHEQLGDTVLAQTYLEQLVALCAKVGDDRCAAETCSRLGVLISRQGDTDVSQSWFEKALEHAQSLHDTSFLARIQVRAGMALAASLLPKVQRCLTRNTRADLLEFVEFRSTRVGFGHGDGPERDIETVKPTPSSQPTKLTQSTGVEKQEQGASGGEEKGVNGEDVGEGRGVSEAQVSTQGVVDAVDIVGQGNTAMADAAIEDTVDAEVPQGPSA